MNNTFWNELTNKTEDIPADIIANAEARISWCNNSENSYKRGIETRLVSVQVNRIVTRLQGNQNNRDTADVVKIREWSYTCDVVIKKFKNGKEKLSRQTYFLRDEKLETLEVGSYYNPDNN